jgi:hypothetical protein
MMEQITGTRLEEYVKELSLADLKRDILGIRQQLAVLNSCTTNLLAQHVIIDDAGKTSKDFR